TASGPSSLRTSCMASAMVGAVKVRSRMADLQLPERLYLRPRVDLVLREHHRRRAEALDDRAHIRADRGTGQQRRRLAQHGVALEVLAHRGDELLQLRRRHGELALLALAGERLG